MSDKENDLIEEVVEEHSDVQEENTSSKTEPTSTKKNFTFDLNKFKYKALNEEEAEKAFDQINSIYTTLDRNKLNEEAVRIANEIEVAEYRLRESNLTGPEAQLINEKLVKDREQLRRLVIISECLSQAFADNAGLNDKRADYRTGISFGEKNNVIRGRAPVVDLTKKSNPDVFLNVLSSALGSASELRIPLPASGFSITLASPNKPQIIGLLSRVQRIEQKLARSSVGYTYSAQVAETLNEILLEFLSSEKIKRCSLQVPYEDLTKYIKRADIDTLLAHFSWLQSPNGYKYVLRCLNKVVNKDGADGEEFEKECGYTEEATVDISEMIYSDNSRLSTLQRNMLSQATHTVDDLAKYQQISDKEYLKDYSVIEIPAKGDMNNITINLRSPSIHESLENEQRWLIKLDDYLDKAGRRDLNNEGVVNLANEISNAMVLSMYVSYIDKIEISGVDANGESTSASMTRENPELIIEALDKISENEERAELIANKISEYMERLKIVTIGIPNKPCPNCGLPQPHEASGSNLIPVNPLKDFFTACHIRIM